jgi:hypothetical protein
MRPTVIKIAAWGERYVESMYRNILPCLATNRFQADLLIYADDSSFHRLKKINLTGFNIILRYIEDVPLRDDTVAHRGILAWTDADSIQIAKERGADWMSFQADTLISNAFLQNVKTLLASNLAVAGSPIRTSIQAFEIIDNRDWDADTLRLLSLHAMHPVMIDYFMRDPPRTIPADPHQFFFKAGNGFVSRTWQPCPYGLSFDVLDRASTAATIDCYLIPSLPPERVYFQKQSDDFYLTSLDDEAGIPRFGSFEMSAMGVAKSLLKFAGSKREIEGYLRTLKQRFVYSDFTSPDDCCDEEITVSAIKDFVLQMASV